MAHGNNPLLAGLSGTTGLYAVYQQNGQTILRTRPRAPHKQSAAQSVQRANWSGTGRMWKHGLTQAQKVQWGLLGRQIPYWDNTRRGLPLSGYQCFQAVAAGLWAQGLMPREDAPPSPDFPLPLGQLTLTATEASETQPFALTLSGPPFPQAVQVYAAHAQFVGDPVTAKTRFVLLQTLPQIGANGASLAEAFARKCGEAVAGQQIAVRLVALSPTGFRGPSMTLCAPATTGRP